MTDKEKQHEEDVEICREASKALGIPFEELLAEREKSREFTKGVTEKWKLNEKEMSLADALGEKLLDDLSHVYHTTIDSGELHAERTAAVINATIERILYTQRASYEKNSEHNGWAEDDKDFGTRRGEYEEFKQVVKKVAKNRLEALAGSSNGKPN